MLPMCPLCGLDQPREQRGSVVRCSGCSLVMRGDAALHSQPALFDRSDARSRARVERYFDRIAAYGSSTKATAPGSKLLAVGNELAGLVGKSRGYETTASTR